MTNEQQNMVLPEEMSFSPEEIPQKKCVILESEWRQLFDAWMRSDCDVRILHKIRSAISNRPHPSPARDFVDTPEKPWCYPGCMLVSNAKAEAARKAREELKEWASKQIELQDTQIQKDCFRIMWVHLDQSIRTTAPQREQAGDHHE